MKKDTQVKLLVFVMKYKTVEDVAEMLGASVNSIYAAKQQNNPYVLSGPKGHLLLRMAKTVYLELVQNYEAEVFALLEFFNDVRKEITETAQIPDDVR